MKEDMKYMFRFQHVSYFISLRSISIHNWLFNNLQKYGG